MPTAEDTQKQNGPTGEEMFQPWMEMYKKWTEESMTSFQSAMSQAQKMNPMLGNPELYELWQQSYQAFTDKVQTTDWRNAANPENYNPENFKKMYETWLENASTQMDSMMRTEAFAAKSGKDLEQFAEYKKKLGELFEGYWETLHLPNAADMREVYHKLYTMDRKLDDLDTRLRNIEKHLEKLAGTKPSEPAAAKASASKAPAAKTSSSKSNKTAKR